MCRAQPLWGVEPTLTTRVTNVKEVLNAYKKTLQHNTHESKQQYYQQTPTEVQKLY